MSLIRNFFANYLYAGTVEELAQVLPIDNVTINVSPNLHHHKSTYEPINVYGNYMHNFIISSKSKTNDKILSMKT